MDSKIIALTGGESYDFNFEYDSLARPYRISYPNVGLYNQITVETQYSNGVAYRTVDTTDGTVYQQINEFDARGNVTQ